MKVIKACEKKKVSVVSINEQELRSHVSEVVRQSVEETLNGLLDAEADALCQAKRYERNAQRASTRAGHYERDLQTKAGTVHLKVPKLRHVPFETAIIERYRSRESSVEDALVEMYLAGVSVRRVEDITEALWNSRVSSSTISDLNQKIFERVEEWRNRPLEGRYPYVFVDGIWFKRSWAGEVQNVSVLVAIGVNVASLVTITLVQLIHSGKILRLKITKAPIFNVSPAMARVSLLASKHTTVATPCSTLLSVVMLGA